MRPARHAIVPSLLLLLAVFGPAPAGAELLRNIASPDGQAYALRTWQAEDGLPQNSIGAIAETPDGYLWVATYGGLARFDGVRFETFDTANTPGLAETRVVRLFVAADGALWIGHHSGQVTRYAGGVFAPVRSRSPDSAQTIMGLGADHRGRIWVLRHNGILETPDGALRIAFPGAEAPPNRLTLVNGRDTNLYVECDGKVAVLEGDGLRLLDFGLAHYSDFVMGTGPGREGGVWIERDLRVQRWSADSILENRGLSPWVTNTTLGTMLETRSGVLAVGTQGHGLYLVRRDRGFLQVEPKQGLPQNWVNCLGEDREGNLWIGTASAGLAQLVPARVSVLCAPDAWQSSSALAVFAASDGTIWTGTEGAGLYHFASGAWTQHGPAETPGLRFVWSIAETPDGRLWAGTWSEGIFRTEAGRFESVDGFSPADSPVYALQYVPEDRALWIGCARGLLRWPLDDPGSPPRPISTLPNVCTFAREPSGTIWVGSCEAGLARIEQGTERRFTTVDGLPSTTIQALLPDADGSLWIGTADSGLALLRAGRFTTFNTSHGLPSNAICHIADDGHGRLWLSTHRGLFRVAKEELARGVADPAAVLDGLRLDRNDGLPTIELSGGKLVAAARTADGRLWYPTGKGLVVLDPQHLATNTIAPPVHLTGLTVDNRRVELAASPARQLHLPPSHQRLVFTFTAPSLTAPSKVRFRYRIDGVDDDWLDADTRRSATYSHLAPGQYVFRVVACNNDGVWNNTGASLAFTALPHFWETWWFAVLAVAAILGAATLFARRCVHRRMRLRLEELQRRNAVERERSRIAQDIHDDVGTTLTRIMMLAQSVPSDPARQADARSTLQRIYDSAVAVTTSLDEIVWAANPRHDSLDSLASYMLGEFGRTLLLEAGLRCRLDVPVDLPHWPLGAEVRHNLFLAFKEALNNAIRHAHATEVRIAIQLHSDTFELSVSDDGDGFAPGQAGSAASNGLANMRQRMVRIGGRCEVTSAPGKGTRVAFVISRPAAEEAESPHA